MKEIVTELATLDFVFLRGHPGSFEGASEVGLLLQKPCDYGRRLRKLDLYECISDVLRRDWHKNNTNKYEQFDHGVISCWPRHPVVANPCWCSCAAVISIVTR